MVAAHGMVWKWDHCGYEELLHIPLIMRVPGLTCPGSTISALTSNIDILPTLLELAEVDQPPGIQGRSMLPLLSGEQNSFRQHVFCDSSDMNITTYDGRWKYVLNWNPRTIPKPRTAQLALEYGWQPWSTRGRRRAVPIDRCSTQYGLRTWDNVRPVRHTDIRLLLRGVRICIGHLAHPPVPSR